jgi:hypothetical protein
VTLRTPHLKRPNIDKLRDALTLRTAEWKAELRAEPQIARLVLRRFVGPMTLWEESARAARWEADRKTEELLDGLVQLGTSPAGFEPALPA